MEELIVSVVSLIVLVPIIYFLPLGLTNKGKGLIILVAFLFANLGILAQNTFHLWQTGLILLLLTILTVYIMDKRMSKIIFSNVTEEKESIEFSPADIEAKVVTTEIIDNSVTDEKTVASKEIDFEEEVTILEDVSTPLIEEEPFEIEELSFAPTKHELEEVNEEESIVNALQEEPIVDNEVDDETAFLLDREHVLEEVAVTKLDDEDYSEGYMSEIERLLESDEEDFKIEDILDNEPIQTDILEDVEISENTNYTDTLLNDLVDVEADKELELDVLQFVDEEDNPHEKLAEISLPTDTEKMLENDLELEDTATEEVEIEELHFEEVEEVLNQEVIDAKEEVDLESITTEEVELEELYFGEIEEILNEEEVNDVKVDMEMEEIIHPAEFESMLEDDLDLEDAIDEEVEIEVLNFGNNEESVIDFEKVTDTGTLSVEEKEDLLPEDDFILGDSLVNDDSFYEHLNSEVAASLIDEEEPIIQEDVQEQINEIEVADDLLEESADNKLEEAVPVVEDELQEEEEVLDSFEAEVIENNVEEPHESESEEMEEPQAPIETEAKAKQEQKSALQQQLFHTMVSQLHLARKQMSSEEYEELIKEHLHPELPTQDYYTFASLLIEHYISHKEVDKLKVLLTSLDGKFEKYPILDMEIHYLYKQYCENTR